MHSEELLDINMFRHIYPIHYVPGIFLIHNFIFVHFIQNVFPNSKSLTF